MRRQLKLLFQQSMMITTGCLTAVSIEACFYHLKGDDITLAWYHPMTMLLCGFLCALPSLLWIGYEKKNNVQLVLRLIVHCLFLYGVVMGMGYLFRWYLRIDGFLFVSGSFFFIYAFVWVASMWLAKQDEKKINKALDKIRDTE